MTDEREDHLRDAARARQKADNQAAYDQNNIDARAAQQIALQQAQLTYQRAVQVAHERYVTKSAEWREHWKKRPKPKDDNPDA